MMCSSRTKEHITMSKGEPTGVQGPGRGTPTTKGSVNQVGDSPKGILKVAMLLLLHSNHSASKGADKSKQQ